MRATYQYRRVAKHRYSFCILNTHLSFPLPLKLKSKTLKIRTEYETQRELAVINNKNADHEVLTHATMLATTNTSKLRSNIKFLTYVLKCFEMYAVKRKPRHVHGQNLRSHTIRSEMTEKRGHAVE